MSCSRCAGVRKGSQPERGKTAEGWQGGVQAFFFFLLSSIVRGEVQVVVMRLEQDDHRSLLTSLPSWSAGTRGAWVLSLSFFFASSCRLQTDGHPSVLQSCCRGKLSSVQRGALEMTVWVVLQHAVQRLVSIADTRTV